MDSSQHKFEREDRGRIYWTLIDAMSFCDDGQPSFGRKIEHLCSLIILNKLCEQMIFKLRTICASCFYSYMYPLKCTHACDPT